MPALPYTFLKIYTAATTAVSDAKDSDRLQLPSMALKMRRMESILSLTPACRWLLARKCECAKTRRTIE